MLSARELVDAHLFDSEEEVIREALRHLLRSATQRKFAPLGHLDL